MARAWVAAPGEAGAVAALLAALRDHLGKQQPSDDAVLRTVERLLEDPGTEFLLAGAEEGAPAAAVLQLRFRLSVWVAAPDAWLEDLFVQDWARRAGLGDALMTLAVRRARARGARRIELDTGERNAAALALYERHGFSTGAKGDGERHLLLGRDL